MLFFLQLSESRPPSSLVLIGLVVLQLRLRAAAYSSNSGGISPREDTFQRWFGWSDFIGSSFEGDLDAKPIVLRRNVSTEGVGFGPLQFSPSARFFPGNSVRPQTACCGCGASHRRRRSQCSLQSTPMKSSSSHGPPALHLGSSGC